MKQSLKKRIKENKMANFDEISMNLVRDYAKNHLDNSDGDVDFNVYIVWKCKILQNWKYLISTTLSDGMYYELTFNGDKQEWYLDAYKKFENICIKQKGE